MNFHCILLNLNSLDNKGSWRILKDFYCSVTMLRELGLNPHDNIGKTEKQKCSQTYMV